MKLGSLCSGAGGLDLAVERVLGAETVWHAELDPAASKVLAYRWPGVPNYGDLITTDWSSVEPVDIMCFGWPCQPFSLAGKRKGHEDERAIWPHIADAVRVLRPRICVMENVAAVLGFEFQRVADDMAALGYDLRWTCLRASDVGAPHRRERVFILAHAAGAGWRGWGEASRGDVGRHNEVYGRRGSEPATRRRGTPCACFRCEFLTALSGDGPRVEHLFPTPTAQSAKHDADDRGPGTLNDFNLWSVAARIGRGELLPTPKASDGQRGDSPSERERNDPSLVSIDYYLSGDIHATAEGRSRKELRNMRRAVGTEEIRQRPAGGPQRVPEADALFTGVREQSEGSAGRQSSLASTQDQEEGPLRGLRNDREPAHSPQGSESGEQRSVEPGGALQFLPQETALAGGPRVHGAPDTGSRWGRYEAAIRRWEAVLGRPAPEPTEPNRNGNPRLNPEFSSWMMGWPAGWVTDVPGLSRNDQLRIIGNGVVPQQAAAALSWLLSLEAVA